jgi:hypothetical protein
MRLSATPVLLVVFCVGILAWAQGLEASTLFQLDFDNSDGTTATESSWEAFTESADTNNKSLGYSGYTGLASGDISITTSGVEFTRDYNNSGGSPPAFWPDDLDDVYNDLILRNDGGSTLNVQIGGLLAGTYQITTHHLVGGGSASVVTSFDLDVTDADSPSFSQNVGTFSMGKADTTSFFAPTAAVFDVTSNGVDPITLRLSVDVLGPGGTGNWMGINGLEILVPEPSSLALLGLGVVGLIGFTRRKR